MADTYSRIAIPAGQGFTKDWSAGYSRTDAAVSTRENDSIFTERYFHPMLTMERQRAQRSRKPFVLMLIDANSGNGSGPRILERTIKTVQSTMRETDFMGWYKDSAVLGVIFTEINMNAKRPVTETLRAKFETAMEKTLGPAQASKLFLSLHVFPEAWEQDIADQGADVVCVRSGS